MTYVRIPSDYNPEDFHAPKPMKEATMNEVTMYRILMIAFTVITVLGALGAGAVVIYGAIETNLWMILGGVLAGGGTALSGLAAMHFGNREAGHEKVFSNPIEREVLSFRQRQELRHKRGGLVMRRALMDIEDEHDNLVNRQLNPPDQSSVG